MHFIATINKLYKYNIPPTFGARAMCFTSLGVNNDASAEHFFLEFAFITLNTLGFAIFFLTDLGFSATWTLTFHTIAVNHWSLEKVLRWHNVR